LTLKVAGTGPLEEWVCAYAKKYAFMDFLGFVKGNQKSSLLSRALALIVPSEWQEPYPTSIMEAGFCGTPVIASKIGGHLYMIDHKKSGLLYKCGDSNALADCIMALYASPTLSSNLSQQAYRFAGRHFSETSNYKQLFSIYKDLIADQN